MHTPNKKLRESVQKLRDSIEEKIRTGEISQPIKHLEKIARGNKNITRNRGELYPPLPTPNTSPSTSGTASPNSYVSKNGPNVGRGECPTTSLSPRAAFNPEIESPRRLVTINSQSSLDQYGSGTPRLDHNMDFEAVIDLEDGMDGTSKWPKDGEIPIEEQSFNTKDGMILKAVGVLGHRVVTPQQSSRTPQSSKGQTRQPIPRDTGSKKQIILYFWWR